MIRTDYHRRTSIWLSCCVFSAALACANAARAEPQAGRELGPRDFAYGRRVQLTASSSPLVSVDIPTEIYRRSRSPDLADVWVFNAAGVRVPAALSRAPNAQPSARDELPVPIFPVAVEHAGQPLDVSISIARGRDGQVLSLQSTTAASATAPATDPRVAAYVLDLRALTQPARSARFVWQDAPTNLLLPLAIEASDDLIHWREFAAVGGLLHLEHAGQRIERDRVEWSPARAAFLRVRPVGPNSLPATLRAVYVEPAPEEAKAQLERLETPGRDTGSGVYRFDLGGPVPVEELELELPEDNTIIAGELLAAERPDGPYRQLAEANFYRVLSQGKPLDGPRLRVTRQRARYYELRVDRSRPGVGTGAPKLITYHTPSRLLFLRRGAAPFTVAYGRHGATRTFFEPAELLALAPSAERDAGSEPAALAAPEALGGDALLSEPRPPLPYKTYALWAVLVAGAAWLLWLAYRLARSDA